MLDRPNPTTGEGHASMHGPGFTTTEARGEKRPLYRPLPPALDYPLEALGPLRPAAEAVHLVTQAPMALCAQSVLGAATLAVQAHHDVILPGGGRKPLVQLFVSIAESGERKTSVDRVALRAVYRVEADWRQKSADATAAFLADKAAWEEAAKSVKSKGKGDRAAIRSGLLNLGGEPKAPPHPMLLIADPTPEALVLHLADGRPWAGVFTAEGGILVGGSAFNDESRMRTGALLNTLWDGEPIRRRRVVTGPAFLPGRRCSAHIMLQPVVADKLLGDDMLDGLGMLARMLVVAPDSTAGTRMFRDRGSSAALPLADYDARLRALLEKSPRLAPDTNDVLDPEPLQCSADARALWIAFHDQAEGAIGDGGEWRSIRAFGAKAAEHAGRLAAVLAAYAGEREVSAEAMACGITLAQHYAAEMIRLKGGASITPELKAAQRLLNWWQGRADGRVHVAEIYQRGPASLRTAAGARAACRILEEHGYIVAMPPDSELEGGPRREAWRLLP
jgi:hypothetical protein